MLCFKWHGGWDFIEHGSRTQRNPSVNIRPEQAFPFVVQRALDYQ